MISISLRSDRSSKTADLSCLSVIMEGISVNICCFFNGGLKRIQISVFNKLVSFVFTVEILLRNLISGLL